MDQREFRIEIPVNPATRLKWSEVALKQERVTFNLLPLGGVIRKKKRRKKSKKKKGLN